MEERRQSDSIISDTQRRVIEIWMDIADDIDLNVGMRMKALENLSRITGLTHDTPDTVTIVNQASDLEKRVAQMTDEQLLALASGEKPAKPKKTTARKAPGATKRAKVASTPTRKRKAPQAKKQAKRTATK